MTKEELIAFEEDIVNCFNQKMIRSPIHLDNGNEDELIKIFSNIRENDWVLGTWRMHYKCLLKGVPPEQLKKSILEGKSISLCFPEYKIFSSAIVSGIIPIALGVALSIKRQNLNDKVYCFLGDMTAETGCFYENQKYSQTHKLPIIWVIEDNEKSVCTDTKAVWNLHHSTYEYHMLPNVIYFKYKNKWPHSGVNKRIQF